MKLKLPLFFLILTTPIFAKEKLKFEFNFYLQKSLEYKNQKLDNTKPIPKIFFKSQTPLKQFQDAIEKQWGQRPKVFSNAYALEKNEIYLLDDSSYYKRLKRCMDDSLIHELIHYIQSKYQNYDLNDEFLELEAIDYQTQFRDSYCKK